MSQPLHRLLTREVTVGGLRIGGRNPVRIQTMTTTDTMDTQATVDQSVRCIEAGAELVRITAPSKKEAENLLLIKNELRRLGYTTPLVADIHFTPNAAEIAARIVEKVRVNPGNYVDKKRFETHDYTDAIYAEEIDRIRERFTPLVRICKEWGTAMRIGTNHGSLSDRIMSRYGDTALGMVESAMEFLRIARGEGYHNIVLSMKSSNPIVMVEAYRTLAAAMQSEFGELYPLHLGVTEAGDGEDGRIKSAIGIGTLLQQGIGDTIRVSLTEDPEFELPVCQDLLRTVLPFAEGDAQPPLPSAAVTKRKGIAVGNIGGGAVPVVVADFMHLSKITPEDFSVVGYRYDAGLDKWNIGDAAADLVYLGEKKLQFGLPGTLLPLVPLKYWVESLAADETYIPVHPWKDWTGGSTRHPRMNVVALDLTADGADAEDFDPAPLLNDPTLVLCLYDSGTLPSHTLKTFLRRHTTITAPVIIGDLSYSRTVDEQLIDFSVTAGSLLLDGMGDGLWLMNDPKDLDDSPMSGRTYLPVTSNESFLNNTAFSILQATRTRISKTEYISCPSCGRTLFDLQETTAKIRSVTAHLKGIKIAIMGCIVNGPGEMADADFGYVGSGPGKITLYKNRDVVKRNVPSEVAVEELIGLLKEHGAWREMEAGMRNEG